MGKKFKVFLHAGESCSRYNENVYDAICLGSERIAHGLTLAKQPEL